MRLHIRALLVFVLAAAAFALPPHSTPSAFAAAGDPVLAWNENAGKAATAACLAPVNNPFHESRTYAIMHIAIHDALNGIHRRSHPYAFDGPRQPGASRDPDGSGDACVPARQRRVASSQI
jgi:hypothetical protein